MTYVVLAAREGTNALTLMTMRRGIHAGLEIQPRWPSRQILIDARAFSRLQVVQSNLPPSIKLIITRGFEKSKSELGLSRKIFREIGRHAFCIVFPSRRHEIPHIFGANGHDVDVSFRLNGRRIRWLPFGVFTPTVMHRYRNRARVEALAQVKIAIQDGGFRIHTNLTESMQIHCDIIR